MDSRSDLSPLPRLRPNSSLSSLHQRLLNLETRLSPPTKRPRNSSETTINTIEKSDSDTVFQSIFSPDGLEEILRGETVSLLVKKAEKMQKEVENREILRGKKELEVEQKEKEIETMKNEIERLKGERDDMKKGLNDRKLEENRVRKTVLDAVCRLESKISNFLVANDRNQIQTAEKEAVFRFGEAFFSMIYGQKPTFRPDIDAIPNKIAFPSKPTLSSEGKDLIRRCLAESPIDRPSFSIGQNFM